MRINRKEKGERNVYTLLERYVKFARDIGDKSVAEVAKDLGYRPNYYYSVKSEMEKKGLLENFSSGPFRINISSNGNNPILADEKLFKYQDSLSLFEDRFNWCIEEIKQAKKQQDYLKTLWDAAKAIFVFQYGQDFRYRFVLRQSPRVFASLTDMSDETMHKFFFNTKDAIAQKANFNSIPSYITMADLYERFIFYEEGSWHINLKRIKERNDKNKKNFLNRIQASNKKEVANAKVLRNVK